MKTRVQKWGNSLAVRIPKALVDKAGLTLGDDVEMVVEHGRIVIVPPHVKRFTLEELLEGVTEDNLHDEIDTGLPVGNEIW